MNIEDFRNILPAEDNFVVISATWCGPCKMLKPILEDLRDTNPDFSYISLDADADSDTLKSLGVRSVPAVIRISKSHQEMSQSLGSKSRSQMLDFLKANGLPNAR
jgi:thioredoxin 1